MTYKGYTITGYVDADDDCIKNDFYIEKDGVKTHAPLSPYVEVEAVKAWIDAGCPVHPRGFNWSYFNGKLQP